MKQKQKSHIRPIVYVMISVFLIIGYAYLTSSLTINGASLLKKATWDVHFENVQVADGSVTGEQVIQEPEIDSEQTTVTFHVNLKKPGDYYEFTVDAVNAGTIDAMINSYTEFDLTEDQLKYLDTSVTYEDGEEIAEKQQLLAGDFAVYKKVVSFKKDLDADDLPSAPEQLDLTYTVEYVQKDDTAITRRAEQTLYNVLKNHVDPGYTKRYTGEHHDSMDATLSTKDIYHWSSINYTNMNNVIFADHCWQMIRTTDTGGVKLIYNGQVNDNKCLKTRGNHVGYSQATTQSMSANYYYGTSYSYDSTTSKFSLSGVVSRGEIMMGQYTCRSTTENGSCSTLYYVVQLNSGSSYYVLSLNSNSHYSQFGTLPFNINKNSVAYVGYKYNVAYTYQQITLNANEDMIFSDYLSTDYWYSDSISWGNPTSNRYNLVDAYQVSSTDDYANLVGKYTFRNSSQYYTNTIVYYIVRVSGNLMYYIKLSDSGNHNLSDFNNIYTYGDSYIDNGNGTYTINNPSTIYKIDWDNDYSNLVYKYFCKSASNGTCSDLWYSIDTSRSTLNYLHVSNAFKYSNSFIWDGNKYILDNNSSFMIWDADSNINNLKSAHYTCLNDTGICTTISYTLGFGYRGSSITYLNFNDGKGIEDTLDEMLYADNVNTKDSIVKTGVDAWFERYLINYSDYLEDTIFCNNRNISNYASSALNPNGGGFSYATGFGTSGLNCPNITDCFSTQNNKAKLNYKVGLISYRELQIIDSQISRDVGKSYWLISPYAFSSNAEGYIVSSGGYYGTYSINSVHGVRPAISLKPGTLYSSGDGSMTNPYVIDTN